MCVCERERERECGFVLDLTGKTISYALFDFHACMFECDCVYLNMLACMYVFLHARMYGSKLRMALSRREGRLQSKQVSAHVYVCICIHVWACMWMCMYLCVSMCMISVQGCAEQLIAQMLGCLLLCAYACVHARVCE